MLKLKVEGPEREVKSFMKDFTNNPQCAVKSLSQSYQNDILENGETNSFCHFEYHPLHEIGKAMVVTFQAQNGEDLTFNLEYGKVIRVGDIVHITGKISSFIPQIETPPGETSPGRLGTIHSQLERQEKADLCFCHGTGILQDDVFGVY